MIEMSDQLSKEFNRPKEHIESVIQMLDEGNTVPFIARYRKERHGSMDDQLLRDIADRLNYLRSLAARRAEVKAAIENLGKLTDELSAAIDQAATLAKLEDLYRPYKQKRRTRATVAREKGLEPLAMRLYAQDLKSGDLTEIASEYVTEDGAASPEEALQGASDIIAELISDDADIRGLLRKHFDRQAHLVSAATTEEDSVYRLYYDFNEPLSRVQSHQILAINRGEKEEILKVSVTVDPASSTDMVKRKVVREGSISSAFVESAAEDAYDRLIFPSMEREIRSGFTEKASEQAIKMFALNLKQTIMQPPVKNKATMGFDPAYRTGCKIAVVDGTGKLLETGVVYPTKPHNQVSEARAALTKMIKRHGVTVIAIGNGTASKESEIFIAELIKELPGVAYMMVNEAGASVYSASKLGAAEFPDLDVSLRSAVSIARRLQDPLAELVKIDPKSIGVGQYQHDMPAARLDEMLGHVVEDCVNAVGVDVNTASPALLSHIAGLTATTARNIVAYREANGVFHSRAQILKVPKIGPKAFEQCAGFLRVPESRNILDHTGVHPESYQAAEKVLEICGHSLADAENGAFPGLREWIIQVTPEKAAAHGGIGVPTLNDMVNELLKPGRDPRDELPPAQLRTDVMDMNDLTPGMEMRGVVRNVVDFGAFVDIGVHQDGLVHRSEISSRFIRHPSEAVKVGDIVDVTVLSVDVQKKRIALSMKKN